MSKSNSYVRLNRIVSAIEDDLLSASDADILSSKGAAQAEKKVRALIDTRLAIHEEQLVAPIPANADDRRMLFEILARSRADVPRAVRMAYGTGKRLSDREISVLLEKLLRSGFFSSAKKK